MDIEFADPWRELSDESEARSLQHRLQAEITSRHRLGGRGARVIGRSDASDDILVMTADGEFAIVHLTWGTSPVDERWPATSFFRSAAEASRALLDR
jgi:hypothetical protein